MQKTYTISKQFKWDGQISDKSASVMRMFGLSLDRLKDNGRKHNCIVKIRPGNIVYITGSSGSGKSVIFRQLYEQFDSQSKINLDDIALPNDRTVIDCIDGDYFDSINSLCLAGLSDVFNALEYPHRLSDGQKYRFRLAKAIASGAEAIFADEFCSNLDRLTAASVAYKISQFARKHKKTLVVASSHDDIMREMMPDVIVVKYTGVDAKTIYKDVREKA